VNCKFNLIPFNPFPESGLLRSKNPRIKAFAQVLMDAGIVTTIRKTRGDDIDAACGQLAGEVQDRTRVNERMSKMAEYQKKFGAELRQDRGDPFLMAGPAGRSFALAGCCAPAPARPAPARRFGQRAAQGRTEDGVRPDRRRKARPDPPAAGGRLLPAAQVRIALDEIKQAIAADPDYADAYGVRALIYTAMGENRWPTTTTGTRCAWRRAIRTWPTTTDVPVRRRPQAGRRPWLFRERR
jgi:hypothetical protein